MQPVDRANNLIVLIYPYEHPRQVVESGLKRSRILEKVAERDEDFILHPSHNMMDVVALSAGRKQTRQGVSNASRGGVGLRESVVDTRLNPTRVFRGDYRRPCLAKKDKSRELIDALNVLAARPTLGGGRVEFAEKLDQLWKRRATSCRHVAS